MTPNSMWQLKSLNKRFHERISEQTLLEHGRAMGSFPHESDTYISDMIHASSIVKWIFVPQIRNPIHFETMTLFECWKTRSGEE